MIKRDKEIVQALEKFRVLSRDQIAEMFYSHLKHPIKNANYALKRLRDRGYIDVNTNRQPYIYFPKPNRMSRDSQKVDHFLKIANFYLQLKKEGGTIKFVHVEPEYMARAIRPDLCVEWRGKVWFIEIQNSLYSNKYMSEKLKRYQNFHGSEQWRELPFTQSKFPYVWIITDRKYKVDVDGFMVFQSKDVNSFLKQFEPSVKKQVPNTKNIQIKVNQKSSPIKSASQ